jgi:hypothetical protein
MEENVKESIKVRKRRGRRRKELLYELKGRKGYSKLK